MTLAARSALSESCSGRCVFLAVLNLTQTDHQAKRLVHCRLVWEGFCYVRVEQHQIGAGAISCYILAPDTTFEQLMQIIFWPQFVFHLTRIVLVHKL